MFPISIPPMLEIWGQFGGVLVEVTNTGEEDKKRGQVHIKQVVDESEVVERTKELIKAEESDGGTKAFIEARAGKDKELKASKDTYSILLALFDSDPKLDLIKLVGCDAFPAALGEAFATVRAKTYEPVVLFAAEATYVPHSPVREEPEGVQDKEGSKGTRTDVPGAASGEVSAFSSDAKQVDAASTATERSLFGDEPPATPLPLPLPPKSFCMHPKKEGSTSSPFTRTLITSKLDTAVEPCIQARRCTDALLLAQGEGVRAAEMPKEEKRDATRDEEPKEEEGQEGSYGVRVWAVQPLIEKAAAFSSPVGFVDLNFQSNN
ncbi:hypothetical protein RSOLAG22IIIB_11131 [Rhizoctonia solani]|uniref:Uncharacterized protein n=1 Tax=Rhizoctonia solani TaxID=456999 RepID=A0A0K6G6Q2_9AGAM|nr:hypothetical protein RSOLAG22IIIB_11131 [Rhizoctonia solani]